jgi:hypothetical protein
VSFKFTPFGKVKKLMIENILLEYFIFSGESNKEIIVFLNLVNQNSLKQISLKKLSLALWHRVR